MAGKLSEFLKRDKETMRNEIGSFYEIDGFGDGREESVGRMEMYSGSEAAADSVQQVRPEVSGGVEQWLKEKSGGREIALFCSGREAIDAVLTDLEHQGFAERKTCLLPAYTCDTVILPFVKRGWKIRFFPVSQELRPKQPEFCRLFEEYSPEVLLAHTYYGVDTLKEERTYIRMQKEKTGMVFIEDMTQSLAHLEPDDLSNYYVGSLRKWFAIPDGGFAVSTHKLRVLTEPEKRVFVEGKLEAQTLKYQYLQREAQAKGQGEKQDFLQINVRAEEYLYEDDRICRISQFSQKRLTQLDVYQNFRKRKENAFCLWNMISGLGKVKPVLNVTGCSPLYVPVYTEERERLQEFLKEKQIFAPVLWPVPHQVQGKTEAETEYVFEHLLALPCDQRYGKKDMERIGRRLFEYETN